MIHGYFVTTIRNVVKTQPIRNAIILILSLVVLFCLSELQEQKKRCIIYRLHRLKFNSLNFIPINIVKERRPVCLHLSLAVTVHCT